MTALVEVENLYRYYGDRCAVHDVSFTLERGDVLGFLGPNGAGKSTTMQVVAGSLAPSDGNIRVAGVDLLEQPLAAKAALGYLPENPPLYRELSVDEYLFYCARLHRIPRPQAQAAVERVKQRCGLGAAGRRLIGNLSKGFQQRVGIAQAIIHSPKVVILDEPTVGLDPIQIREIRALIRELGEEHAVILSTHILPEVQTVCNRVQIIHQGRLVFADTVHRLVEHQEITGLVLNLVHPPHAEALASLPGVIQIEPMGATRYRLRLEPDSDPTTEIAAYVVNAGWGLRELIPERRSLEQVFVELTAGEESPAEAAA